jgi:hypothetical protein
MVENRDMRRQGKSERRLGYHQGVTAGKDGRMELDHLHIHQARPAVQARLWPSPVVPFDAVEGW